MDTGKKLCLKLSALALALTALIGAAAYAAGAGTSTDPLVTVSYLENTFTPSVTSSVDAQISAASAKLEENLAARIRSFSSNLSTSTSTSGAVSSEYASYVLVAGQSLQFDAGTEILFLSGSATAGDALMDATSGQALSAGAALTPCHLYVAIADGTVDITGEANLLVK